MTNVPFFDLGTPQAPELSEYHILDSDAVTEWARQHAAPVKVVPEKKSQKPNGVIHSMKVGRIGISRTIYGVGVSSYVEGAANAPVIATTNLRGHARPTLNDGTPYFFGRDGSFVFDLSQGDHRSQVSEDNAQLQITFDPRLLDDVSNDWFGNVPDRKSWRFKTGFGGRGTSWHSCQRYVMSLIANRTHPLSSKQVRHIEETLCSNLLSNWAAEAGINLDADHHTVVPRVVRMAEEYMIEHAADAPTLTEVARYLDVSVRTLTMNFKKFRGCTVGQYLKEERLQAARKKLLAADRSCTVVQIAAELSYINMGEFAKAYRERFGERPSETLRR